LSESGVSVEKRNSPVDEVAAELILRNFLDRRKNQKGSVIRKKTHVKKGGVAFANAAPPRVFPCPIRRSFLPVPGKKSGNLAAYSYGISNFRVSAAKIWGCHIEM